MIASVVGDCNPYQRPAGKWPENHHRRTAAASLVGPWAREKEERRRERKCLEFTWCKTKA